MSKWFKRTCRVVLALTVLITTAGVVRAGGFQTGGLINTGVGAFTHAHFSDSASITNPWWTLPAGTNYLYFSEVDGECEWNLVEVLDSTTNGFFNAYAGTEARIILDRAWVDENCEYDNFADVVANVTDPFEVTYDWLAQDDKRNIWYMGEDTLKAGSSEGSFVAGCDGAEAGIVMLGRPRKGDYYLQEFYEGEAEDTAKVVGFPEIGELDCLKTREWSPLDPVGSFEYKNYCGEHHSSQLVLVEAHEQVLTWKYRKVHGVWVKVPSFKDVITTEELIDTDVVAPPPPSGPPFPTPGCAP